MVSSIVMYHMASAICYISLFFLSVLRKVLVLYVFFFVSSSIMAVMTRCWFSVVLFFFCLIYSVFFGFLFFLI